MRTSSYSCRRPSWRCERMGETTYFKPCATRCRDAICRSVEDGNIRTKELVRLYETNPEFFYREAPINGALCLNNQNRLLGLYRIKRPRRIAEKANRYVANWIFKIVQERARELARERAREYNIPLEELITPKNQMDREFVIAERDIAQRFRENKIELVYM